MKKAKNVSKALMKATGVAVFGSVIACGAALMAMHEGFKTAGNIVKRATEEDDTVVEPEQEVAVESEIIEEEDPR